MRATPALHSCPAVSAATCLHRRTLTLCSATAIAICAPVALNAQVFMHLTAADSVRVINKGIVHVDGGVALLLDYAATSGLTDTVFLRKRAVAILGAEKPHLDSLHLANLVVRAVDKASDSTSASFKRKVYGFVIQLRTDGKWYFLHDSTPVAMPGDSTSRS